MAQAPLTVSQKSRALAALGRGATNPEAAAAAGCSLASVKRLKAASAPAAKGRAAVRAGQRASARPGQSTGQPGGKAAASRVGKAAVPPRGPDRPLLDILRDELTVAIQARDQAKEGSLEAKWSKRVEDLVKVIDRLAPPPPVPPDVVEARLRELDLEVVALLEQHLPEPIRPEELAA